MVRGKGQERARALAARLAAGQSTEALQDLAVAYRPMVESVARRMGGAIPIDDLIQEGYVILGDAAFHVDEEADLYQYLLSHLRDGMINYISERMKSLSPDDRRRAKGDLSQGLRSLQRGVVNMNPPPVRDPIPPASDWIERAAVRQGSRAGRDAQQRAADRPRMKFPKRAGRANT